MEKRPFEQEPQQPPMMSDGAKALAEQMRAQGLTPQPPQPKPGQNAGMAPMGGEPVENRGESVGFAPEETTYEQHMSAERLAKAMETLNRYKAGKANLESRLIEVEQWWKIRHWEWMQEKGDAGDMKTSSAWLFNVIISKHADGIQSSPEANILPREEQDQETAKKLNSIIPCVLEENRFDETYSDVLWQKCKGGTGVYGVFWNGGKLNGLGDIEIRKVNLLRLFWEPGITDIQDSQNVFYVDMVDTELLEQQYADKVKDANLLNKAVTVRKFMTEDVVSDEGKTMVVDWYYHKYQNGRKVLHYCKFVGEIVLYSTEDDPKWKDKGLYEHGMYPFVFDALFPVEASPCGFGYVDVCKNAQEQIDILDQAVMRNALVNAVPRYFVRTDGSINEEEFADYTKPFIHVTGNLGADSISPVVATNLNGNVLNVIANKINELKETSGNTDSSNGVTQSGSMAASAIAALQEASGKVSRASSMSAYRAFKRIITLVIELIRQFYDTPRQFRILGEQGNVEFMTFDNSGMGEQALGNDFGQDMYRLPVFDVKVEPQTKTGYTKNSQNELAMNLYGSGIFNPQMSDQALMLLDLMQFEGKDELRSKISENGTLAQQLAQYQQIALQLAQQLDPMLAEQIAGNIMQGAGAVAQGAGMAAHARQGQSGGGNGGALTKLGNARDRAQASTQLE